MAWTALTEAATLIEGFNPSEQAQLAASAGTDGLATIVTAAIKEARDCALSAGVTLDVDATKLPDALRPHVIALARWRWLIAFPSFKSLQTDARRDAAKFAEKLLMEVAKGEMPIEPPTEPAGGSSTGEWNANVAVAMRMATTRANP